MTALLRLYPQAWRERYEVEFLDVLAARPPSLTDRLDILLGAVDAHLEPEVPGTERVDRTSAPRDRIGAGLAITGGLLWVASGILLVTASFGPEGFRDAAPAFIVSLFAGLAAAAAMVVIADGLPSHRVALRVLGLVSVVGVLLVLVPWPVIVVGLFGQWTASAIAGALLMGSGARVAGGALVAGSILAFGTNTENLQAALLVPYGLAWLVVGASLLAGNGWVTRAYPGQG